MIDRYDVVFIAGDNQAIKLAGIEVFAREVTGLQLFQYQAVVVLQVFMKRMQSPVYFFQLAIIEVAEGCTVPERQARFLYLLAKIKPQFDFGLFVARIANVFVGCSQHFSDGFFGPVQVGGIQTCKLRFNIKLYLLYKSILIFGMEKQVGEKLLIFYLVFHEANAKLAQFQCV